MAMEVKRIADDAWFRGHISVGRYVFSSKFILFPTKYSFKSALRCLRFFCSGITILIAVIIC